MIQLGVHPCCLWQVGFSTTNGGGGNLAGGSGGTPSSSSGVGNGANSAGTGPLQSLLNDPNSTYNGAVQNALPWIDALKKAGYTPGSATKPQQPTTNINLPAHFGDVNVSQNVTQKPVVNAPQTSNYYGGSAAASASAGAAANIGGGSYQPSAQDQWSAMAGIAQARSEYYRNQGNGIQATIYDNMARQYRGYASNPNAGVFGQAPQITQTAGTWQGLLNGTIPVNGYVDPRFMQYYANASGGISQIPQVQIVSGYGGDGSYEEEPATTGQTYGPPRPNYTPYNNGDYSTQVSGQILPTNFHAPLVQDPAITASPPVRLYHQ